MSLQRAHLPGEGNLLFVEGLVLCEHLVRPCLHGCHLLRCQARLQALRPAPCMVLQRDASDTHIHMTVQGTTSTAPVFFDMHVTNARTKAHC